MELKFKVKVKVKVKVKLKLKLKLKFRAKVKVLIFSKLQAVVDCNALETLVPCLEEFDPTVKEAASWAIGYIAQHTAGD